MQLAVGNKTRWSAVTVFIVGLCSLPNSFQHIVVFSISYAYWKFGAGFGAAFYYTCSVSPFLFHSLLICLLYFKFVQLKAHFSGVLHTLSLMQLNLQSGAKARKEETVLLHPQLFCNVTAYRYFKGMSLSVLSDYKEK